MYFKNANSYSVLMPTAAGNSITVPAGKGVEGEYFARFKHLQRVDSLPAADVVWSQSSWEAKGKKYLDLIRGVKPKAVVPEPLASAPKVEDVAAPVVQVVEQTLVDEVGLGTPEQGGLDTLSRPQLVSKASSLGIADAKSMKKADLIVAIAAATGMVS